MQRWAWLRARAHHALLAPILGAAVFSALWAVDFGRHWDEPVVIAAVDRMIGNGVFLPNRYNYPSVLFYLPLAGAVPHVTGMIGSGKYSFEEGRAELKRRVNDHRFLLRTRRIFAVLTLGIAIASVYALIWAWRRSAAEALLGAAVVGGSFELSYHARWVAADGPMAAFAIAAAALLGRFALGGGAARGWLYAGAVLAGFSTGSKYPAGVLLVPVVLAPLVADGTRALRARIGAAVIAAIVFGAAYLVTTPATLLEPFEFVKQLAANARVYREEGHGGHTVSGFAEGAPLLVAYVALVVPSFWPGISAVMTALALFGVVAMARGTPLDRRVALVVLLGPTLYLAYFSTMRVMLVRNILFVAPFLGVLVARGASELAGKLARWPALRIGSAVAVAGCVAASTAAVAYAAWTVVRRHEIDRAALLREHIAAHPGDVFALSPRIARELGDERPANVGAPAAASRAVYYPNEAPNWDWTILANRFRRYTTVGPYDVNADYYPSWQNERPFVSSIEAAHHLKVPLEPGGAP